MHCDTSCIVFPDTETKALTMDFQDLQSLYVFGLGNLKQCSSRRPAKSSTNVLQLVLVLVTLCVERRQPFRRFTTNNYHWLIQISLVGR